ncbi:hypothetical protein Acr_23g0011920 [Actinidia rufa]|uniref:Reverse transcriptase zinc-binding domain-containing protein n=1 Tax=Actinidia rufa TaxID=165716 RepID=A0A7J0GPR3_9ERIC|nr:hypothetical protein Acr_23g0011920 [Actinidia rufa]
MGKNKTKNRGGGSGAQAPFLLPVNILKSTKDTTTLVATDTRTDGVGAPELNVSRAEMLGTLDEVDEIAEIEEDSEKESDSISRTLEEYDSESTISVRRNVSAKIPASQNMEVGTKDNGDILRQPKPYVSFFAKNRLPGVGSKLELYEKEDGPIPIDEDEVQLSWNTWQFCLVGYFGGVFLSEDIQMKVLENGPYMIYGRPLMLRVMSQTFNFKKEEISHFPVWIQLRNLPLSLWGSSVLSKICSRIGKPVYMDKLTTHSERISYARCLVEIDMSMELPDFVILKMHNGVLLEHNIFYENLPRFCPLCKVVGHSEEGCQAKKSKAKNISVEPTKNAEVSKVTEVGTSLSSMTVKGQGSQQEWVTKKSKTTRTQTDQTVKVAGSSGISEKPLEANRFSVLVSESDSFHLQELGSGEAIQNSSLVTVLPEQQFILSDKAVHPQHQQVDGDQQQVLEVQEHTKQTEAHLQQQQKDRAQQNQISKVQADPKNKEGKITEGSAIYSKQAQLIASGEMDLTIQQKSKELVKANQIINKDVVSLVTNKSDVPSTSLLVPGAKTKKDRKKASRIAWNIRGFNKSLKHKGILEHLKKNNVDILGILETKLKHQRIKDVVRKKFNRWKAVDNFQSNPNGRILIFWREDKVELDIIESSDQGISTVFLSGDEKLNGNPVTSYEVRDFQNCCYELGITDLRFSGVLHTWSNNSIWSKLDRAMVNEKWGQEGISAFSNFGLPGKYSDHSPCVVSLFGNNDHGASSFKFFNMWAHHADFLELVGISWSMRVEGSAMFRLCKKLKALKGPLRTLNKLHYSHISARAQAAEDDLLEAQQLLHDNPRDDSLQSKVVDLRGKACRLDEAEISFCSQLAKAKYLKNCDKGTKFFHDLIKNNRTRNQVVSLTKSDGVVTTSPQQVSSLFVEYYENLLGTRNNVLRLDSRVLTDGARVENEQALALTRPVLDEDIKVALFDIGDDKAPGPDGIPVAASRLSIEQFNPLISRISEHISSWAGAYLSYAGRSELIRSVLQGVDCFWLSILPIPVGVRQKVIALCRNFLWGGKATSSKKPLVAWRDICRPKGEGGLGFIELHAWNLALLSKSLWNLQSKKDSLWVKWMNQVYIRRDNFWEYVPAKQDSQMVKQLADIRDKVVMEVGSNRVALDTLHKWVSMGKFNVKAAYEFFRVKGPKVCWTKIVWHRSLMPKHSFMLWLSLKERLLTRDKLTDHIEDTSCVLCGAPIESINHLFFQCPIVSQVWEEIKGWLGFSRALTTIKAASKWIIKEARGTGIQSVVKKIGFACSVYHIWKARNMRIFEGKVSHPSSIIREIKIQVYRALYVYFPNLRML